ncbi:DNA-binding helix-turn-helix protein [Leptospira fainei serovar Hurstbridge str. BUT 6]|uniref:DNA-binding helix-turn-helix protein n=1 Tax=Leptospira fainei serovar Hurstbridge str. BUT 6 TaxID=1193011 RepID=S3UXF9_9LEPT|nr:DNA-binding helix-turn-helix protein [Leptospira fainei serovar Hurstbridge str. BUT 6]
MRQARISAELTQEDVAQALGIKQSLVSKIESCQRRVDVLELLELSRFLGKPVEFFFYPSSSGRLKSQSRKPLKAASVKKKKRTR